MSNPKGNRVVIGYSVDTASQQKAIQSIAAVQASYDELGKKAAASLDAARARFDQSRQSAAKFREELKRDTDVAAQLQRELALLARQDAVGKISADFAVARSHGVSLDDALQQVVRDMTALGLSEKEIQRVAAGLRDVSAAAASIPSPSLGELTSPIPRAAAATAGGGAGLAAAGRQLRHLPAVDTGLGFSTDMVGRLAEVVGKLGISGGELFNVLGIGVPIVIAAKLALDDYNKSARQITAGLRAITERTREYYEQAVSGTTDTIQSAVERAEIEQQIAQARLNDLQVVVQGYEAARAAAGAFDDAVGGIIEAGGILQIGGLEDVRNARIAYDEAVAALAKANGEVELFSGLLDDTATAARDAAAAQLEAQRAYEEWYQQQVQLQAERNIDRAQAAAEQDATVQRLRGGTAEQAGEYYAQLEADARSLAISIDALKRTGDTSEEALKQIEAWEQAQGKIADLMRAIAGDPQIQALAAAEQAARDYTAALQSVIAAGESAAAAERELTEARKAAREEQERHIAAVAQIRATEAAAQARAETERTQALAALDTQSEQRRNEAIAKAQEAREQAETRHLDTLRQIRETFAKDARGAAASLDAHRLQDAIEARNRARKDETREYKSRKADIEKALREQTDTINNNLKQQQALIQQRYDDQLAEAAATANAALAIEQNKYVGEMNIRVAAYNYALQQAQIWAATMNSIAASLNRNIVGDQPNEVTTTTLTAAQAQAYIQAQQPATSLDRGTRYVQQDMNARLHMGEGVLNRVQNRNYNNQRAVTFNGDININGNSTMTKTEFREVLIDVLEEEF